MEVYILDSLLRRVQVIDKYESLIWTERFSAFGDFELVLPSTLENRSKFNVGAQLACNDSYRMMTVETIDDTTNEDGEATLTISGPSVEKILEDRVAKDELSDLATNPKWVLTGTPGYICRTIFNTVCVAGALDPGDVIPFITAGNILPADSIAEPTEEITVEIEPQSVYDIVKKICDLYDLGFRFVRNFDNSQLLFNIYSGSDRSVAQSVRPAIVFSPGMDNLQNVTELTTMDSHKNCAYVFSPAGYEVVYPSTVDPGVEGFERRVLVVNASDIQADNPDASALMIQRGLEELSKRRIFKGFDGEVDQYSTYKYGVDYQLGDLVTLQNKDGAIAQMRVTEQILVSDKEGERSYPTLTIRDYVTPGSWLGWDFNQVWADLGATDYWSTV